ncbi:hypothetical protein CAPTEDRAFT_190029 [Capitella teleta]|uniref:Uncharacterized protein n=1 Tax=Capitella teleta TaxID=283909 RepID=R7UZS8_CAPTE|nr:hypothetical protein CAPTEDRAFT_190029 [Capitella teleta]|eukprot:ELU11794.1 hypothetical protein CAPTEDRAFT_190029 [Capitella teleta]
MLEDYWWKYFLIGATASVYVVSIIYLYGNQRQTLVSLPIRRNISVFVEQFDSRNPRGVGICSQANFRATMLADGYFPSRGRWQLPRNGFPEVNFIPDYCYLNRHSVLPISECFAKRKWKRILTIGDSIANRHLLGLISALEGNGYNCTLLRAENITPKVRGGWPTDPQYYLDKYPGMKLQVTGRPCFSCGGRFSRCVYGNSVIELEQLPMPRLADASVTLPPKFNNNLDFYFKKYLANDPPDLFLYGPTFIHEIAEPVNRTIARLFDLITMFNKLVPRTTDVVWFPAACVFGKKAKNNHKLLKLNHILFDQLEYQFVNDSHPWHGFYDEYALTIPLSSMKVDDVHMQQDYYNVLMEHFASVFCN